MGAAFASLTFAAAGLLALAPLPAGSGADAWPARLSETGLFEAGSVDAVHDGVRTFTPQYPLWSDGATKRRWVRLPAGLAIDGSRPAAWEFPRGTRFWKEFSVGDRRVETRVIERAAGGDWRFAAYVWNEAQTDAVLAPNAGIPAHVLPGGARYAVPGEADCRACHDGGASPVLGFTALQLSPDRDPLAPRAEPQREGDLGLRALVEQGSLLGFPSALLGSLPRIRTPTPAGRAALGYLAANCGHCHADPNLSGGAVPVQLQLALDPADEMAGEAAIRRLLDTPSRFRPRGAADARIVVAGDAGAGTLLARMRSRDPRIQMPPLGTSQPDLEAIALIERWIDQDLTHARENPP